MLTRAIDLEAPFLLTLCDTSRQAADAICPDGFTFVVPSPTATLRHHSQLAPSQYQANWRRTGGAVDGGRAVNLLTQELMPLLQAALADECLTDVLDGFHTPESLDNRPYDCGMYLPPIPLDFVSAVAWSQNQTALPVFAAHVFDKLLSEYEYPVWQIYRASWRRDAGVDPSRIIAKLISGLTNSGSTTPIGLRMSGSESLPNQLQTTVLSELDLATFEEAYFTRRVKMSGLTFMMQTKLTLGSPPTREMVDDHCKLVVDQILPRSVFIDEDEAATHFSEHDAEAVFPMFHDIELPTHLAAPAIYRTAYNLRQNQTTYDDEGPELHDRYQLDLRATSGLTYLEPPSVAIECQSHPRTYIKLIGSQVYPKNVSAHPNAVLIQGMSLPIDYLGYVSVLISAFLVVSIWVIGKSFFPLIMAPTLQTRHKV